MLFEVPHQRRAGRGFTLVEMLVVIAVIAMLVGIFMPALIKARQAAMALQCSAALKEINSAMRVFAHSHDDRLPGDSDNAPDGNTWDAILNREYFKNKNQKSGIRVSLGVADGMSLSCPLFVYTRFSGSSGTNEGWAMNTNATGGQTSSTWPAGPYGTSVDPSYLGLSCTRYRLGAKISKFHSPAMKFLVIEHERTSATFQAQSPYDDKFSTWHLGDNAGYPIWSGKDGNFSFRHGSDGNRRGNFLFVDGHVESLSPKEEMNTKRRWLLDPW